MNKDLSFFGSRRGTLYESRRLIAYVFLFVALFGALDYAYYLCRSTAIERLIIDTLTVRPAAAFINKVVPEVAVTASGNNLISPFGEISILQGCEGTEAIFLLIAAIVPFPAAWEAKLLGIVVGIALIYVMNQLRILALVFTLHWHPDWFASLHGLIAPTSIVVAGCLFFFFWANRAAAPLHT